MKNKPSVRIPSHCAGILNPKHVNSGLQEIVLKVLSKYKLIDESVGETTVIGNLSYNLSKDELSKMESDDKYCESIHKLVESFENMFAKERETIINDSTSDYRKKRMDIIILAKNLSNRLNSKIHNM